MKHKIILTDMDGVVLEQWVVEDDWGDVSKPIPGAVMRDEIASAIRNDNAAVEPQS